MTVPKINLPKVGVAILLIVIVVVIVVGVPYIVWDFTHGVHSELVRLYGNEFAKTINDYEDASWNADPPDHVEQIAAIITYSEQCAVVTAHMKKLSPTGPEFWVNYKLTRQSNHWTVVDARWIVNGMEPPAC